MGVVARKLRLGGASGDMVAPKLSLPGKLVFPSMHHTGHFSMLGTFVNELKLYVYKIVCSNCFQGRINHFLTSDFDFYSGNVVFKKY